jgi:uncharacterized protein (DUF488 family)
MTIYTIGHSNHSQDHLLKLLSDAGIDCLLDVRATPFSRRNPQFNAPELESALKTVGISYRHAEIFGGKRGPTGQSPNVAIEEGALRNYADHALTSAFQDALDKLITLGAKRRPAIMCAEANWRHCHRRIITDHLLGRGQEVLHLLGRGGVEDAILDPVAQVDDQGVVTYPPRQGALF